MPILLEDDHMCYVCGKDNVHGLRLIFDHKPGLLRSSVVFSKQHQGYKNIVHGGLLATVLDEMIVNLCWKEGLPAVTAELTVRLKKPTKVGQEVLLEGHLGNKRGRVLMGSSFAKNERGELLAAATATCITLGGNPKPKRGKLEPTHKSS